MIQYVKSGIDENIVRLLRKLEPEFPIKSLIVEIENFGCTVNKVLYDGKLYGILIVRAFVSHKGLLCLEIDHAVAEDDIDQSFASILRESLWSWAKAGGFEMIFQHAHRAGLARMLKSEYGEPQEWIFKKDLRSWEKVLPVQKQRNQQQQHPTQPTRVSGQITAQP